MSAVYGGHNSTNAVRRSERWTRWQPATNRQPPLRASSHVSDYESAYSLWRCKRHVTVLELCGTIKDHRYR